MQADTVPPIRVDVLGIAISCVDLPSTVDIFTDWIARERRQYVCVTGMHGVMESQVDATLRDIHNSSGLTTPDGMPMVWAGRRAGARISRVYGPDLMDAVLSRAVQAGWSSYFLGGSEDVLAKLVDTLEDRYPGLAVAGYESPPFRPLSQEEDTALVDRVNAAAPDIVWVGLGTPKQERFMASHRQRLRAPVLVGVGAAFDLVAGTLPQAPPWMQRNGLEWAFRLGAEPRRLWRRYLLNGPRFAIGMVRNPPRLIPQSGYHTPDPLQMTAAASS
jgi:N-acetylglucosaminyldiphosphoundecaprenol N-acetyl-beta-D-mannosaminyltransferase